MKATPFHFIGILAAFGGTVAAGATFHAEDSSSDPAYADEESWLGVDGGEGFGAWEIRAGSETNATIDFRDLDEDNEEEFALQSESGEEVAVGRDLDKALVSGNFQVKVWHGEVTDFRGMAVYGTEGEELLRWGVMTDTRSGTGVTGFWQSTAGDGGYELMGEGAPSLFVTYSLTWESLGDGLRFSVAALHGGTWDFDWTPFEVVVDGAKAVKGVGAVVTGKERLVFENLAVNGEPVPEPSTVGLLLAGAFALGRGRKGKRGE